MERSILARSLNGTERAILHVQIKRNGLQKSLHGLVPWKDGKTNWRRNFERVSFIENKIGYFYNEQVRSILFGPH